MKLSDLINLRGELERMEDTGSRIEVDTPVRTLGLGQERLVIDEQTGVIYRTTRLGADGRLGGVEV